jgi:hypothetical protein
LEIWNVGLNSIDKKNRGTSSIQLNILILQLTVSASFPLPLSLCLFPSVSFSLPHSPLNLHVWQN